MAYFRRFKLSQRDSHRWDGGFQHDNSNQRSDGSSNSRDNFGHDGSFDGNGSDNNGHRNPGNNGQSNRGDNSGDSGHFSKTTTSDSSSISTSQTSTDSLSSPTPTPTPTLSVQTTTTTVSQSVSDSSHSSKSKSTAPAVPNGSPITLVTTASSTATATAAAGLSSNSTNTLLVTILIPTILVATIALTILSILYVRRRRNAKAAAHRRGNSAPNGAPEVKSWNTINWPGFERIRNRASFMSRRSSPNAISVDLERGSNGTIRPCPNPKIMSNYSLPKASAELDEMEKANARRFSSSMFSITSILPGM